MKNKTKKRTDADWLGTFTKKAVALILAFALVDLQLTYILAFLGRVEIAESLSKTIASTIVGVMLGYFLKALFETFFEEREKRLNKQIDFGELSDERDGSGSDRDSVFGLSVGEGTDDSERPVRDPAEFGAV